MTAQTALLGDEVNWWYGEWVNMPEFTQQSVEPAKTLLVNCRSHEALRDLSTKAGWNITPSMRGKWYPDIGFEWTTDKRYGDEGEPLNPRHPVYVISKGRSDTRLTSRALEALDIPYHIVVEPQEVEAYAQVIDPGKILELPFSDLGQGSIPARNWVWEHAISTGASWHWILDDNLRSFYRLHQNQKIRAGSGTVFGIAEDFVSRYENVGQAGFNYESLVLRRSKHPPFHLNTRIYSCILIRNDLPFRWRGRYNEDTDLSLRILKDGWCTILFNTFLADKQPTMTMTGGNSDELYQGDGRRLMAESLAEQHPDVTRVTWKWGRAQHHVDYKPFRGNRLQRKPDLLVPDGPNNFGMVLQHLIDGRWITPGRPDEAPADAPDQPRLPAEPKQLTIFDEIAA